MPPALSPLSRQRSAPSCPLAPDCQSRWRTCTSHADSIALRPLCHWPTPRAASRICPTPRVQRVRCCLLVAMYLCRYYFCYGYCIWWLLLVACHPLCFPRSFPGSQPKTLPRIPQELPHGASPGASPRVSPGISPIASPGVSPGNSKRTNIIIHYM